MRDRSRLRLEPMTILGAPHYEGALIANLGQDWYVDPNGNVATPKRRWGNGKALDKPFQTLAEALSECATGDRIFITGNIREENLICSNLKFDVKIIGVGGRHHPDQPSSAYHPGAAMIRPPASPTAATPLLVVRGRGWEFHNVAFDCPVDAAAVQLNANALSDVSEYDASHAKFFNCLYTAGFRGIQDVGGCINVSIQGCQFRIISEAGGCAIVNTSTAVRLPQYWRIGDEIRNVFHGNGASGGNESHIDAPLSGSVIVNNIFGTVEGTGKYIDLTGGDDNDVCFNSLAGVYDTDDYVAGTADRWYQNACAVVAVTAPDGVTLAAPAAP